MLDEPLIRLAAFGGTLAWMFGWEALAPRRALSQKRLRRWRDNLGLAAAGALLLRFTVGAAAYGAALLCRERGWGALALVSWPPWFETAFAFVFLDFAVYVQHIVFHAVPLLWRLHRVHHTDLDFDTTTGVRFHPFEIFLSMLYKAGLVFAVGAPPLAVLIFEIVLNATSLFNHGNVRIPRGADRVLRALLVTPDMHRVHHSVIRSETDSNFGFNFSFWDRLCGTYRALPVRGHLQMEIGVDDYREPAKLGFARLLIQPLDATSRQASKR